MTKKQETLMIIMAAMIYALGLTVYALVTSQADTIQLHIFNHKKNKY